MAERERLAKLGELKSQEMMSQNLAQLHPSQLAALHGMQGQHMPTLEQLHQYQGESTPARSGSEIWTVCNYFEIVQPYEH